MAELKSLPTLAKASTNANDVLLVSNTTTGAAKKYLLTNLFPVLATSGTGSELLYINATNKNQLNFKGLKTGTSSMLSLATVANNLELKVLPAGIDLSLCDNVTSQFSTGVNFNKVVTGICGVTKGGTGLGAIAKGAVLVGDSTNQWTTKVMNTNGQLLIGNAAAGFPSVATLTAGANMSITNAAGAITLAATLGALTAPLDTASHNIDLNTNYISPNGTDNKGIYVHSSGKVAINDSGSTLSTIDSQLHLMGTTTSAITIGNAGAYQSAYTVQVDTNGSSGVGAALSLLSGEAGGGNSNGGALTLKAGAGTGSGTGGMLSLYGGDVVSGTAGAGGQIRFYVAGADASSDVEAVRILNTGATYLYETTTLSKTLRLAASSVPTVIKYQGAPAVTDAGTTAVSAANILTGIVTCNPGSDHAKATDTAANLIAGLSLTADGDSVDFVFINLGDNSENRDITLSGGTAVTLVGNMHISSPDIVDASIASGSAQFRIRRTSGSAVTMYRIA
tara:strand:+ start:5938 stop:7458 length:1521 start_codon:yes stop_codon:yes gene_type:complete